MERAGAAVAIRVGNKVRSIHWINDPDEKKCPAFQFTMRAYSFTTRRNSAFAPVGSVTVLVVAMPSEAGMFVASGIKELDRFLVNKSE